MALVACVECGKSISDKAASCPQCGFPAGGAVVPIEIKSANPFTSQVTSSATQTSKESNGCASVVGGIAIVGVGILVCIVAFKVFNFIIGAVGGVLALIGLALMGLAS